MTRTLILAFLLFAIAGCAEREKTYYGAGDPKLGNAAAADYAALRSEQRESGALLAYEHWVAVDTREAEVEPAYDALLEACRADRENECTVLNSDIDLGDYSRANIRMRVKPEGVEALVSLAAGTGEVVRRGANVEDLARTIFDIEKRIAMLTTTRDRLLELEERGADDIESLIKITTELTRVQAELEELQGQSAYQRQRVDTDILSVDLFVESGRSFWRPIGDAMSSFGDNLSEGLGDTITAVAYLLPWSILLFFVGWLLRWLWKRSRRA